MPSRRSHPKSHHGCVACKQRRIKCDEARPTCGACQRQSKFLCSFQTDHQPSLIPIYHCQPAPCPQSLYLGAGVFNGAAHPPTQRATLPTAPQAAALAHADNNNAPAPLPLMELELLHHWYTAASVELVHDAEFGQMMRTTIPRIALSHPFLMHGILAISAFHLIHFRRRGAAGGAPGQAAAAASLNYYADAALRHKDLALSQYIPLLGHITEGNWDALFAFSSLVVILSFAAQVLDIKQMVRSPVDVVGTFRLVRGTAYVVAQTRSWIERSELVPIMRRGYFDHGNDNNDDDDDDNNNNKDKASLLSADIALQLQLLLRRCQNPPSHDIDAEVATAPPTLPMHVIAVRRMIDIYNGWTATCDGSGVLAWPVIVDLEFLDSLIEGDKTSLTIFSYYGVILHQLRGIWWLDGLGRRLVLLVADALGDSWRSEIQWPLKMVGGDVKSSSAAL